MKVLLSTHLSKFSGYGNDGIGLARALLKTGVDLYLQPSFVSPPLPEDLLPLFSKAIVGPFDLTIQHLDPMLLGIDKPLRQMSKTTVAMSMWEFSSLDNMKGRSTFRKRMNDFDAVLGYDQVSVDAFRGYLNKKTATGVVMGGFVPGDWTYVDRDWFGDRFGFCMVGQLHDRKDPFVAVQAFHELKNEFPKDFDGAELHMKTNIPTLHPAMEQWCPKLRIHSTVWPTDVLKKFYETQHVLLAPSRGEGKNMPALEFQSTGGAVIATNWGGMATWLSDEYAYPLNYSLKPLNAGLPNCKQARADKAHLKELMMHVYKNREEVKHKGWLASQKIPQIMSWEASVERMFNKLAEIVPGRGQDLLQEYKNLRGEL